ncbi:MAG TPA: SGNH/GDSL hydrolase family protein [Candidatus Acidoferrum sp.]|nr:SGNH/GDSL hydrolase family protein [Candidatus Acidoferrum sp.]
MKKGLFLICALLASYTIASAQTPPSLSQIPCTTPQPPLTCDCRDLANSRNQITRMENTLKDWPNLARYREENTKIAPPAKDENRVVFMGDSITDFWAQPQMAPFFPGKPYIGRGISGQTTPQMLLRFRPDVIALQPRAVVILAGTNDIAGNTGPMSLEDVEGNLASMSEFARSHGTKVILSSVLPVYDGGHNRDGKEVIMTDRRLPEKILALNGWIKKYSADNNIIYLDYFSAMVDDKGFLKRDLSEDGLHPNKKGYDVMAPLAEAAIAAALKK